jgi:uncharacterized protein
MSVAPTYPGVYIQEISSGVRTITGVATSITAFVGRAPMGNIEDPVTVFNFGEYVREFGGLHTEYPMSYTVRDFFLNGGGQAVIVRLVSETAARSKNATLKLEASSPGEWGDKLTCNVETVPGESNKYNLTVFQDGTKGRIERFLNVSIVEGPRRLDRVLKAGSGLVRVQTKTDGSGAADLPTTLTAGVGLAFGGGVNGDTPATWDKAEKTGLYQLEKTDLFNLLCIPPETRGGSTSKEIYQEAMKYCVDRRAMLIVDPPGDWSANKNTAAAKAKANLGTDIGLNGLEARNTAIFFPRVIQPDPLREGQLDTFVPCGIMAGLMARTDVQRGVWKAPAGIDAGLNGIQALEVNLTDDENGLLNQVGINCLRSFPVYGRVAWGSRTLRGADQLADEYKYIPVRRTALFIEESLFRGLKWVVFEPNDEPLWSQIRLNVGAFMHNLFRQGAFQGSSPRDAYFVKCDKETTTQNDINLGIVNVLVGFAPLKPAEFVIVSLQQMAGQIEV